MKNALLLILSILFLANTAYGATNNTTNQNVTFVQGIHGKKPVVVLLYAPWSDKADSNMALLKQKYGNKAYFIAMDISTSDAKAYSDLLPIQPKLPNVMMFKEGAKITRFISRDCVLDTACFEKKVLMFVH